MTMRHLIDDARDNPLDNDTARIIAGDHLAALGEIRDELRALTRAVCILAAHTWGGDDLSPNNAIPLVERFVRDAHAAPNAERGQP